METSESNEQQSQTLRTQDKDTTHEPQEHRTIPIDYFTTMETSESNEKQPFRSEKKGLVLKPLLRAGDKVLNFCSIQEFKMFVAKELVPFFENFDINHPGIIFEYNTFLVYRSDLFGELLDLQIKNWGIVDFKVIEEGLLAINAATVTRDEWTYLVLIVFFTKWIWQALYFAAKGDKIVDGSHNIILHENDALLQEVIDKSGSVKPKVANHLLLREVIDKLGSAKPKVATKSLEARLEELEKLVAILSEKKKSEATNSTAEMEEVE